MRVRTLLAAVAVAVAAVTPAAPARAESTLFPCVGAPADEPATGLYPERRVFLEGQTQWMPSPGQVDNSANNNGHEHLGACIPERETLTAGNVDVWTRILMYDNPGTTSQVSLVFKTPSMETTVQEVPVSPALTCPVGVCVRWLHMSQPISLFDHSGLQEVRFRSGANEPNGKEMRVSLNWQLYIANGKSLSNVTRMPYLRGKGWYSHSLYCEGSYPSVPVPDVPVSGVWQPTVMMDTHSSDASLPVTHYTATIDPDGHVTPPVPGMVIVDADGRWPAAPITVDTTLLANGVHKLLLRSGCRDDTLGSTNWGVLVVAFVVAN
jgi:hypothetical protein